MTFLYATSNDSTIWSCYGIPQRHSCCKWCWLSVAIACLSHYCLRKQCYQKLWEVVLLVTSRHYNCCTKNMNVKPLSASKLIPESIKKFLSVKNTFRGQASTRVISTNTCLTLSCGTWSKQNIRFRCITKRAIARVYSTAMYVAFILVLRLTCLCAVMNPYCWEFILTSCNLRVGLREVLG